MKETKTQRELLLVIDEMTNIMGYFEKTLEQQKEDSSNRIGQLEACLTTKEEIGMLKNEIETLKEENSKLKYDMSEK